MTRSAELAVENSRSGARVAMATLTPSLEATWTFVAGALAGGVATWEPIYAMRLLAAWLIADTTLRFVFQQLMVLKASPLAQESSLAQASLVAEASPLAQDTPRPRGEAWTRLWPCASGALVGTGIALSMTTFLGRQPLLVTAASLLAAALCAILAGGRAALLQRWLAFSSLSAAWLLGHAALAPLDQRSIGLALLVGLAGYARAGNAADRLAHWVVRWAWALLLLWSLAARQPVVAGVVASAALAELATASDHAPAGLRQRIGWLVAIALVASANVALGAG